MLAVSLSGMPMARQWPIGQSLLAWPSAVAAQHNGQLFRLHVADVQPPPWCYTQEYVCNGARYTPMAVYAWTTIAGTSMAHILVVEDNPLIVTIVSMGLKHSGHTVHVVDNGTAVLPTACATRFDLILLDVLLPGAHGFEVLKQLKAHPATAMVPVFMLTGQSDGSSILHGLDSGADAYLSKPVDMPDLLARIARVVAQPRVLR